MCGTEKKELGHATVVLAENHRPHTVFGGVHLVFSGDFFQLPPENHRVAVDPSYADGWVLDHYAMLCAAYGEHRINAAFFPTLRAPYFTLQDDADADGAGGAGERPTKRRRKKKKKKKMGFMGFKMAKKGYMYYDPAYMTRVARRSLTKPHDMPSLVCIDCGGVCSGGGWSWTAAHQGEVPCCCAVDDPSRIFAVVETQARTSLHLHLFDYFPVFECKNCHIAVPASAGMFTTSQGGGGHCAACSSSDGPCGSDDLDLFN